MEKWQETDWSQRTWQQTDWAEEMSEQQERWETIWRRMVVVGLVFLLVIALAAFVSGLIEGAAK